MSKKTPVPTVGRASIIAWMIGIGVTCCSHEADAFCRTTTCDRSPRPEKCGPMPEGRCDTGDTFLTIESGAMSYSVDEAGSLDEGITADQLESLVREIFDTWQSADCGDGRRPSVRFDAYPRVRCNEVRLNPSGPNQNVWTFVDHDWLERGGKHTATVLALTTVQFNKDNGHIYGADVEINSDLYDFTLDALDMSRHDLRGILQHESGHYFGLAHSFAALATMQSYVSRGDELEARTLDADDVAGICAIYPPGKDVSNASSEPFGGFTTECVASEDACCSIAVGANSSRQRGSCLMLLLALCCVLRRSKLVEPIARAMSAVRK